MTRVKSTEKHLSTSSLKCLSAPLNPDFLKSAHGHVGARLIRELWSPVQNHRYWRDGQGGEMGTVVSSFPFFFHSSFEREAALLRINHSGLSWDLCLFGAGLNRKHSTSPSVPSTRLHGREPKSLPCHTPHTPPSPRDPCAGCSGCQRSSRPAGPFLGCARCHQRALEADEGLGHWAVCPGKVHIWMRWWLWGWRLPCPQLAPVPHAPLRVKPVEKVPQGQTLHFQPSL